MLVQIVGSDKLLITNLTRHCLEFGVVLHVLGVTLLRQERFIANFTGNRFGQGVKTFLMDQAGFVGSEPGIAGSTLQRFQVHQEMFVQRWQRSNGYLFRDTSVALVWKHIHVSC